jgi:hypothetical protein
MGGGGWDLSCKAEVGGGGGLEAFDRGAAPGCIFSETLGKIPHILTRFAAYEAIGLRYSASR